MTSARVFGSLDAQPFCSPGGDGALPVGAVPSGGGGLLLPFSDWQLSSSLGTHRDWRFEGLKPADL